MTDETDVTANTLARAVEPISKMGYMDGAADGQTETFQSSFDTGYKLGFNFSLELGIKESQLSIQHRGKPNELELKDSRKINCQMCLENTTQDNVENLYNKQTEKNTDYLQKLEMALKQ